MRCFEPEVHREPLADPDRWRKQVDIADEVGLPSGTVSKLVQRLDGFDLLERNDADALWVRAPSLLLDAWAQRCRFVEQHPSDPESLGLLPVEIGPTGGGARPGRLQNLGSDFAAIVEPALLLALVDTGRHPHPSACGGETDSPSRKTGSGFRSSQRAARGGINSHQLGR